jgi:hypothetical protein
MSSGKNAVTTKLVYINDLAQPQIHCDTADGIGLLPVVTALLQIIDHRKQGIARRHVTSSDSGTSSPRIESPVVAY